MNKKAPVILPFLLIVFVSCQPKAVIPGFTSTPPGQMETQVAATIYAGGTSTAAAEIANQTSTAAARLSPFQAARSSVRCRAKVMGP